MGLTDKFDQAFMKKRTEVRTRLDSLGQRAVDYAKANGNYHDRTGHLRQSNSYEATEDRLVVRNTASYASNVEKRGRDVLSGAKLMVMGELRK